jgi:hypothetical protein
VPESFVNQTEGSGKKSHSFQRTIGANTVEDQVVIQGNPYLAAYTVSASGVSVATVDSHTIQVMAGASLNVYILRIRAWQVGLATTAGLVAFRGFRLTTAGTGGSVITPRPLDTTDAAAGATAMTLPSSKGTESTIFGESECYFLQTLPTAVDFKPLLLDWSFDYLRLKALRIPAGTANGIALKLLNGTAAASATVWVDLFEANF